MDVIKLGNTTLNKAALEGMTETQFKKAYRGKINVDIDKAWKSIRKFTGKPAKGKN